MASLQSRVARIVPQVDSAVASSSSSACSGRFPAFFSLVSSPSSAPSLLPNSDPNFVPAVPNPVLGGVTTFLFASVMTSGARVLSYIRWTRRDRFVLAAALSFGVGDLLVPGIFTHLFDGVNNPGKGLQGLFDSITIVLSTPCECCAPALTLREGSDVDGVC